jgi:hypothetical protein
MCHVAPKKFAGPILLINGTPLANRNTQMQPSANMEKAAQSMNTPRMSLSLALMKLYVLLIIPLSIHSIL